LGNGIRLREREHFSITQDGQFIFVDKNKVQYYNSTDGRENPLPSSDLPQ
jgi:hypothetical protein